MEAKPGIHGWPQGLLKMYLNPGLQFKSLGPHDHFDQNMGKNRLSP